MNSVPFITVCIPVRNEERSIQRTIGEIQSQDYPQDRYEIIVADGESSDKTPEIVRSICRKYPNVLLFNNPQLRSSSGRNIGFKNGKGDIFLVVDGHCLIGHTQLFREIVNCFEKSGAQCLGRPQPLDPPGISDFIAGAYLVTWIMRTQTMAQVYAAVTWQTLAVAMGAAVLVGLVFGTYPALKAANLSPVDAMRYE